MNQTVRFAFVSAAKFLGSAHGCVHDVSRLKIARIKNILVRNAFLRVPPEIWLDNHLQSFFPNQFLHQLIC